MPEKRKSKIKYLGGLLSPLDFDGKTFEQRQEHIEDLLCRSLSMRTVVTFIGSGTSFPIGYPMWGQFAKDVFKLLEITLYVPKYAPNGFEDCLAIKYRKNYLKKEYEKKEGNNNETSNGKSEDELTLNPDEKAFAEVFPLAGESLKQIEKDSSDEKDKTEKINKEIKLKIEKYIKLLTELIGKNYSDEEDKEDLLTLVKNYRNRESDFDRFSGYLNQNNKKSKEIDFQSLFSECERLLCSKERWDELRHAKFFRIIVKSYFQIKRTYATLDKKDKLTDKEQNPYLALLDLNINKFATFNYDLEIERALLYAKSEFKEKIYSIDTNCEQIIKYTESSSKVKSFSQKKDNCEDLVRFSISGYDPKVSSVFHCHGRIDDTEHCVISEEDYQKWYLQEDDDKYIPFRQTLDIILESNPILFMGFSLSDADFMRILRYISANRTGDKTRKPLFCLLYVGESDIKEELPFNQKKKSFRECKEELKDKKINKRKLKEAIKEKVREKINSSVKWETRKELEDECTMLYIKYGLHVILVEEKNLKTNDGKEIEPTCHKLIKLNDKAKEWWQGVVKKPRFRKFDIKQNEPYFHYEFDENAVNKIDKFDDKLHEKLNQALELKTAPATPPQNIPQQAAENNKIGTKPLQLKDYFSEYLAVVVGDGGTGKSWSVQQYLKQIYKEDQSRKIFFWRSYYTNDVLTGIDRLVEFFVEGKKISDRNPLWLNEILLNKNEPKYGKFEFLKLIIDNNEDAIIVFDGVEKLLRPNTDNTEGESVNPEVREFFKILTNKRVRSKIIITTRLFPSDIFFNINEIINNQQNYEEKCRFLELKNKQIRREKIFSAPRCWTDLLLDNKEYLKINSDFIDNNFGGKKRKFYSSFCSLFDGHIFAISIMKGILEGLKDDEAETKQLLDDIIKTPVERRVNEVIKCGITYLDKSINTQGSKIHKRFIERISLFMHPIREEVAHTCFDNIDKKEREKVNSLTAKKVLDNLVKCSLVQVVKIDKSDRYVVHPLIRSYVFEILHESRFSSLPGLQLPGVTSSKEVVDPGNKTGQDVSLKLFSDLCKKAEDTAKVAKEYDDEADKADLSKNVEKTGKVGEIEDRREKAEANYRIASDMCRAAFSIIRSRFCTNTVARWGNYSDYTKYLLLLFDTAKKVSKKHWDFNEPTLDGLDFSSDDFAPLYSDELAWLYNEIGIATFSMGSFTYSAAILGEGFEINRLIDREFEGRYTFQSNLNKGAISLHYGKLDTAMEYLDKAHEVASRLNSDSLVGRVIGYIATVKYLRGNLEEANIEFAKSYEALKDNLRAKSYFLIAHGELLLKLGKVEEAFEKIEQSRHIAESVYYPDLVAYSKLARANYYVKKDEHVKAQYDFQYVLQFAKNRHLRRLEVGTLSGMSRLAEKLGDYSIAVERAIEALKISNEYSIRLHQTLSLIVLGVALINGHQHRDLGVACLKTAKSMAQKQEYFLRLNEADEALLSLNIES